MTAAEHDQSKNANARPTAAATGDRWWIGLIVVIVLTLGALLPFVGKAFHIDDPTYLWTAEQILKTPLDFYGYTINWYGNPEPMHEAMMNPPLTSYFIALVALVAGFGEVSQHVAFVLWAVGLAVGVFALARRWNAPPVLAALATMFTPGVLVSATNVMCDVMLACLWVWAIVLWERGLQGHRRASAFLIGAGICIAAAALTKYFGLALVPLLAVHGLMTRRRPGWWLLALLIPVAAVGLFDWWAYRVYGHGLVFDAAGFSSKYRLSTGVRFYIVHSALGLAFAGGCGASALFFWPRLWSHWIVVGSLIVMALITFAIGLPSLNPDDPSSLAKIGWGAAMQGGLWITIGAGVIALPIMDLRRRFDAASVTLALWVWGTFVFSAYLNWSVTARTILPLIPAVGLLIARQVQAEAAKRGVKAENPTIILPLALSAALALAVAWGDMLLADSARTAARFIAPTWTPIAGRLLFQGHWGFQYYMQREGAEPLDLRGIELRPGDRLVIPRNNCNIVEPKSSVFRQLEHYEYDQPWFVTTTGARQSAGYYSSVLGVLPFVFGPVPPEVYDVYAPDSAGQSASPR